MTTKADEGGQGWNGDIFTGVGYTFQNHYYLAAEIFGNLSSAKKTAVTSAMGGYSVKAEFKNKFSYGISLIPGIKVSDSTMMYGRIGLNRSKFEFSAGGQSVSKTKNGLQLGIGAQTMVANNVSVRMEYDWNRFGDIKAFGDKKLTTNQVKLQVAYHFENLI
jgi:opacity protein-like surface antigen